MASAPEPILGAGNGHSSTDARRLRSKELAQKRRTTYKGIMDDLTQALPFPKDVVSQLDYNSRLRLALCYFRLKSLVDSNKQSGENAVNSEVSERSTPGFSEGALAKRGGLGLMQDFVNEALDGFLMVALTDGTITFLSESIHKHLGLFQSEHIGISLYDLVLESDHDSVRDSIHKAELTALARLGHSATAEVGFFCRMKCSRFKVTNTISKTPGYKLVYISGSLKVSGNDTYLIAVARPVSPPSIMEIKVEGNMFVTHYSMDMKCNFFDGRLFALMGYNKKDLLGDVVFTLHHHDDTEATMECSKGVMSRGEGLSGYFRFLTKHGFYLWLQTRATVMHDSRTGKPSYILCMNFVINKEIGDDALKNNATISAALGRPAIRETDVRSHDPFPLVSREDGKQVNPLNETKDPVKNEFEVSSSTELNEPSPSINSSAQSLITSCEPDSSCPDLAILRMPTDGSSDSGYNSRAGNSLSNSANSSSPEGTNKAPSPDNPPSVFGSPLGSVSSSSSLGRKAVSNSPGLYHPQLAQSPQFNCAQQSNRISSSTNVAPQLSAILSTNQPLNGGINQPPLQQSSTVLGKRSHSNIKQEDPAVQIIDYQPGFNGATNPQLQNFQNFSEGQPLPCGQFISQETTFIAPPQPNVQFQNGGFGQDALQGAVPQHSYLPDWNEQRLVKNEFAFSNVDEILPSGFSNGLPNSPPNNSMGTRPNFPPQNGIQFQGFSRMQTQQFPNMPTQQFSVQHFPNVPTQQFVGMPTGTHTDLPQLTGEDMKILDDIGRHF